MYNWILGIHSLLRWLILVVIIINIARAVMNAYKPFTALDSRWNLRLLIAVHINFLVGFYNYFFGGKGYAQIKELGFGVVMKNKDMRFWAVEHLTGMLIFVIIITISRRIAKNTELADQVKHKKLLWYYIVALIVLLASIPWPFRFAEIPWYRPLN